MILRMVGLICFSPLPLHGKLGWCHVSDGRVDPLVVVIRKGVCKCNLGILIGSKLTGPYVLLFECLVETTRRARSARACSSR